MKNFILLAAIMLLCGCTANKNDVLGIWKNKDGATFIFSKDGTFVGKKLLSKYFTFEGKDNAQFRMNGSGTWQLKNDIDIHELWIKFEAKDDFKTVYNTVLYLENLNDKPYIYVWQGEDGDEDYKYSKQ